MRFVFSLLSVALGMSIASVNAQVLPSFGNSRTASTGFQFLKIAPDARIGAMGGTGAATSKDVFASFWNPALISRADSLRLQGGLSSTKYFGNIFLNSAGLIYRTNSFNFFSLSIYSLNSGDMEETTEFQPYGTGRTFSVNNFLATLTYSRILTDNFSFGVNSKWAHEGIGGINTNNLLFDLGIYYNTRFQEVRFGAVVSNFGVNVTPQGSMELISLGEPKRTDNFDAVSVPAVFRLCAAWDPIRKENHYLTLAAQLNHPTDNNETFSFGAEYRIKKLIFIRSGYEFGQDEKGLPSAGIGIDIKRRSGRIRLDYGFSNKVRLGNIHRLTLCFALLK